MSRPGRMVVQAWLASRGLLLLVAVGLSLSRGWELSSLVQNWDVQHFSNLARNGYFGRPDGTLMAFFPGLPLLLRVGLEVGLPIAVTGVALAAVGSAFAAAALLRLGGPWAAITWLFAPTAVFTAVPYTESLFCAAAFWAWERARADRWSAAAPLAAMACTFRVSGLFLVGALVVMIVTTPPAPSTPGRTLLSGRAPSRDGARPDRRVRLKGWGGFLRERLPRLAWLLLPLAVIVGFISYLYGLTGSWTAWYTAQSTGWERALTWPWDSFRHTLAATHADYFPGQPLWPPVFAAEIVSMAVGVLVVGWCLGKRKWAEASWVGVQVLAFSISFWFFSVNRAILLWFPLWVMLAELGSWRPGAPAARWVWRVLIVICCAAGVAVMLAWSWLYFTGNWAS